MDGINRDFGIRMALRQRINSHDSSTVIVDELPLRRGLGKADVAAINGRLIGYEIKSASDTLSRLGRQIPLYDSVFERSFVVVTEKHVSKVKGIVPAHWGIILASMSDTRIDLRECRRSRLNEHIDPSAVAMLLWRDEVLRVLRKNDLAVPRSKMIARMWAAMLGGLTSSQILCAVRHSLKARHGMTSDESQTQCDD